LVVLLTACAGPTQVIDTDLTRVSGVYVIAYVDRPDLRERVERGFVHSLEQQGVRAVPSGPDLPDIKQASPAEILAAANRHRVAAVLIVNRLDPDGANSLVPEGPQISPRHPDLRAYLQRTRQEADDYADQDPVFVEANAFLVDGNKSRRVWSGTSWTLLAGETDAIASVGDTIAEALAAAIREARDYGRPI